ncbi:DUF1456 family protein [Aliiglaciecola sp. LCG003]|uniref:DUF1456 family protein n=1 Tax=Aliiglaciecola sp. LCG003 TaxID=3053655 RepID=UPI002572A7F0|nr:DUF1456 family protein [Aliiglaciecola sp. LCG003]WJG08835.1 DUF1456 family protein [Aliiglaciecola sp. LCG003]
MQPIGSNPLVNVICRFLNHYLPCIDILHIENQNFQVELAIIFYQALFMNHNDVLRRLRYALQLNDEATISIFALADHEMDRDYLKSLMKKEEEDGFLPCRDKTISLFLDGLIIKKRGKQEGVEPQVLSGSQRLSNNEVLRKIRIAMSYRDEDMIAVMQLANFRMSKGELNALFRKPDHRNYKEAGDQVVRNLLKGMVIKLRPDSAKTSTANAGDKKYVKARPAKAPIADKKVEGKPVDKASETTSVWGKVNKK